MGEYAKRKKDGLEIKIGTCTAMYYMTASQVFDIEDSSTNMYQYFNNLTFRIWVPHEENILVGDFETYQVDLSRTRFELTPTESDVELFKSHPGLVRQEVSSRNFKSCYNTSGATGIVLKFKCCHGFNDNSPAENAEDNSLMLVNNTNKARIFCLEAINFRNKKPEFVCRCGICGKQFCFSYSEFIKMKFYDYNTFKDHDEFIDLKNYINKKLYDLQFGENADFYKNHIDFSEILHFIPSEEVNG